MLYLSLILIISGIFFILYTLISRTRKEPAVQVSEFSRGTGGRVMPGPHSLRSVEERPAEWDNAVASDLDLNYGLKEEDVVAEDEIIFTDYSEINRAKFFPDTGAAKEEKPDMAFVDIDRDVDTYVDTIVRKDEDALADDSIPGISWGALYEDSSNLIDYNMHDSIIDSTLKGYEKIKRLGEGTIEILENGINFKTGNRFFRFDFHRMADFKKGSNFLMLSMKGSNVSRLFLFKEGSPVNAKFDQVYKHFKVHAD